MATEEDSVLLHVLSRALSVNLQLQRLFNCYFCYESENTAGFSEHQWSL